MMPAASVTGQYFAHPDAHYFGAARCRPTRWRTRPGGWTVAEAGALSANCSEARRPKRPAERVRARRPRRAANQSPRGASGGRPEASRPAGPAPVPGRGRAAPGGLRLARRGAGLTATEVAGPVRPTSSASWATVCWSRASQQHHPPLSSPHQPAVGTRGGRGPRDLPLRPPRRTCLERKRTQLLSVFPHVGPPGSSNPMRPGRGLGSVPAAHPVNGERASIAVSGGVPGGHATAPGGWRARSPSWRRRPIVAEDRWPAATTRQPGQPRPGGLRRGLRGGRRRGRGRVPRHLHPAERGGPRAGAGPSARWTPYAAGLTAATERLDVKYDATSWGSSPCSRRPTSGRAGCRGAWRAPGASAAPAGQLARGGPDRPDHDPGRGGGLGSVGSGGRSRGRAPDPRPRTTVRRTGP